MSTLETPLPSQPWSQHSFTLAKSLYKKGQHRSFLNREECQLFENALDNVTKWTTFLESNQVAVFRTRAMLAEQFIHSPNNSIIKTAAATAVIEREEEDEEPDSPIPQKNNHSEENDVAIPILDVYHSLEFDMPAMLEQRRLDHKQQLEMKQEEREEEEKVTPILNDSDHFDLKYLLKGISENRAKTSLSDRELRNLLLDIKPHRSKWANDNKIGQEDLYEACEKVLTELKNFTDHSGPFLNKVSKREAPDYHEVISEPMDLGTVTKKLKHFQYKTKKEFSRDLYLIYENCLLYNTHPSSEYRKHAIAMKRKTDRLLAKVPDIEIKEEQQHQQTHDDNDHPHHKSEDEEEDENHTKTEGEDEEGEDDNGSDDKDEEKKHKKKGGKGPKKVKVVEENHDKKEDEEDIEEEEEVEEENHEPEINARGTTVYSGKQLKKRRISTHSHDHEDLPNDELENIKFDLQAQTWLDLTKKTRAKMTTDVEKQYQFEFGNRHVLKRSPLDMQRFSLFERLHHKPHTLKKLMHYSSNGFSKWVQRSNQVMTDGDISSDDEEDHNGSFFFYPPKKKLITDNEEAVDDLFLPEYALTSGIPEIEGIRDDIDESELERSMESLDIDSSTKCPPNGLNDIMDQNIQTLTHIRSIYQKCDAVRKDTPLSSTIKNETMNLPSTYKIPPSIKDSETTTSIDIDKKSGEQILQRSIIQLLTHAGFESAHTNSLNVLTDMMTDYLTNLGKTLRYYLDDHGKEMNGEEIVLHSLYENGINGFSELEDYIMDDVVKAGNRLSDVKRKLEHSFKDLVSSPSNETVNNETIFDDEEVLISGVFGEELGEDFFGFKELGIAQEYNMNTLNVPSKLWFGKEIFKKVEKSVSQEHKTKYKAPPPFLKVTKQEEFVGLLQPWYSKRLQEHPDLLEDEYLPRNRHKTLYPPTSSAFKSTASSNNKKRVLKDGSNTQQNYENRKKRKHEMEELKAEKKRQKLEIKAQKLAEKEQKKKEKEELRLAKKDKKQPIVN